MIVKAQQIDRRTYDQCRGAAVHEAAHATLAVLFRCKIEFATIEPTESTWGRVLSNPPLDAIRRIAFLASGYVAQIRFVPSSVTIRNDRGDIADIAATLDELYPVWDQDQAPHEFRAGVELSCKLVKQHRKAIKRIADRLLARTTLDGAAIRRLMRTKGGSYVSC